MAGPADHTAAADLDRGLGPGPSAAGIAGFADMHPVDHSPVVGRSSRHGLEGSRHHMHRTDHRLDRAGSRHAEVGRRSQRDEEDRSSDLVWGIESILEGTVGRDLAEEDSQAGSSPVEGTASLGCGRRRDYHEDQTW
jgi:hypothetical protein